MPLYNSDNKDINLTDSEAIVLSLIRDIWKNSRMPASNNLIYGRLKGKMPVKEIKQALVDLHRKGKMVHPEGSVNWIPILSEEEILLKESMDKTSNVSDEKIYYVIRKFYAEHEKYPKPSEIEHQFIEAFGIPSMNIERNLKMWMW